MSSNKLPRKVVKKAAKMYPWIEWVVQRPEKELSEVYGEGFIITGIYEGRQSMYFILNEDPRIENWIHMIAIQLDPQVQEDV